MFSHHIRTHLRSNLVGYLALFFALGLGTAWAVERNSIRSKHIADGQVKAKDVKLSQVQARIGSGCEPGRAIRTIAENGTVTCEAQGGPPSGPASGDLRGAYPAPTIAAGAVNSAKTANGSLTGQDVTDDSLDGFDISGLSSADMQANTLTGGQINESTLGEVPNATIAGHGGYGRQSGGPEDGAFCNPGDTLYITCASVDSTPSAPARFLVIGRVSIGIQNFQDPPSGGHCRLGSNASGGIPGTTVGTSVTSAHPHDHVTLTGVTDVYQPGNYSFGIDCRETSGDVAISSARVIAVAISPY